MSYYRRLASKSKRNRETSDLTIRRQGIFSYGVLHLQAYTCQCPVHLCAGPVDVDAVIVTCRLARQRCCCALFFFSLLAWRNSDPRARGRRRAKPFCLIGNQDNFSSGK